MSAIAGRRHCIASTKPKPLDPGLEGDYLQPRPCPGWAHGSSEYCFPHDPAIPREAKRAYGAAGGRAGRGRRKVQLRDSRGVLRVASLMLNGIVNRMHSESDTSLDLRLTRALTALVRAILYLRNRQVEQPLWRA